MPNFPGNDLRLLSLKVSNSPRKGPWGGPSRGCSLLGFLDGKNRPSSFFFRKEIKIGAFSVSEA